LNTKHLKRRLSGLALIVFGLLCFLNVVSIAKMATVSYIDIWVYLYPGSTDSASPDMVTIGSTVTLTATLRYADYSKGWYSDPYSWTVTVDIYKGESKVQTVTLYSYDPGMYIDMADWTGSWTIPNEEGTLYRLVWNVNTYDSGTTSKNTYAKTPLTEPDGSFKVNGKDTSQTSTLHVVNPTLTLSFTPSKAADKITGAYVEVWNGGSKTTSVTMTKQTDGTYTGSYTLPNYGTYELRGYVEWNGGNPLRKMSALSTGGAEEGPSGRWFGLNQAIGLLSIAIGVFLMAKR